MKKKVLLLDEDITRKNNTASRLRTQDFEPLIPTGGFHIMHLLERNSYGALIIFGDAHDMSAIEIIGLIRVEYTKQELPIVYLCEKAKKDDIYEAFESGANEVISLNQKFFSSLIAKLNKLRSK